MFWQSCYIRSDDDTAHDNRAFEGTGFWHKNNDLDWTFLQSLSIPEKCGHSTPSLTSKARVAPRNANAYGSLFIHSSTLECPLSVHFFFSFSCSKFILQLKDLQVMSHSPQGNSGLNRQAKTLELVYNFMACHSSRHGGHLKASSPFNFLSVYRKWTRKPLRFFKHIFTQSLFLLGSGGILGHITDGSYIST